jgi:hypothetical protein
VAWTLPFRRFGELTLSERAGIFFYPTQQWAFLGSRRRGSCHAQLYHKAQEKTVEVDLTKSATQKRSVGHTCYLRTVKSKMWPGVIVSPDAIQSHKNQPVNEELVDATKSKSLEHLRKTLEGVNGKSKGSPSEDPFGR